MHLFVMLMICTALEHHQPSTNHIFGIFSHNTQLSNSSGCSKQCRTLVTTLPTPEAIFFREIWINPTFIPITNGCESLSLPLQPNLNPTGGQSVRFTFIGGPIVDPIHLFLALCTNYRPQNALSARSSSRWLPNTEWWIFYNTYLNTK